MAVRAVVDTNIVVSAFLSKRGAPHALLTALQEGAFHLVLSPSLREEYEQVLARPIFTQRFNLSTEEVGAFFRFLDRRAQLVTPDEPYRVAVRDPKDEHVLATALDGDADFLVTGDVDLLTLAGDAQVGALRIVTVRAFLDALTDEERPRDTQ